MTICCHRLSTLWLQTTGGELMTSLAVTHQNRLLELLLALTLDLHASFIRFHGEPTSPGGGDQRGVPFFPACLFSAPSRSLPTASQRSSSQSPGSFSLSEMLYVSHPLNSYSNIHPPIWNI
ncbi:hypothetical protein L2E82_21120 [Cichorium intybus]|uniref:Uncharacterized protein n=1 Tax=Cichorium intybus TaxID=13427 RepID=A0ACB9DVB6_CICIN|nr:hypothetical protein L2E82_21120 [Cichorium intybus]